jgi:hypothetical protein
LVGGTADAFGGHLERHIDRLQISRIVLDHGLVSPEIVERRASGTGFQEQGIIRCPQIEKNAAAAQIIDVVGAVGARIAIGAKVQDARRRASAIGEAVGPVARIAPITVAGTGPTRGSGQLRKQCDLSATQGKAKNHREYKETKLEWVPFHNSFSGYAGY